MTRGARTAVVVGVAVTTALLASLAAYQAVAHMPVREVEVATSFVVAAARPLPTGTLIGNQDVKLIGWPAKSPVAGALTATIDVVGRGLIAPVLENEPITEGTLALRQAGAGLPPTIPPGMRALALRVNELIGVAGFVVPGTYVDVIATLKAPQTSVTRIVATHIRVLAAGTRYDAENAKAGTPIAATVVTLLVTPSDAERIALASAEGQIVLMLRNPLDTAVVTTPGVRTADLTGGIVAPLPAPAPAAPDKRTPVVRVVAVPALPPVYSVEAIRALKRAQEIVR